MIVTSKGRRTAVQIMILIVMIADLVLVGINWKLSLTPSTTGEELRTLEKERDLMNLDLKNAQSIRRDLPEVQKQCDEFFEKELHPMDGGYSLIVSDLSTIARDSGLQISAARFNQHGAESHGVNELSIVLTMEGPYPSLVSFINALERSGNFYLLDSLALDSSNNGLLRLSLDLRTYFRS
ncbi:MAG TPA: GspMb/PilO family protein [Candidatus Acidoferrales bacterium]|nr:GspMb/PilO family protein [Candidatus Acidoferrales bacterium]